MKSKLGNKQIIITLIAIFVIALVGFFISYKISSRNQEMSEDKSKVITDSKQENRDLTKIIHSQEKNLRNNN